MIIWYNLLTSFCLSKHGFLVPDATIIAKIVDPDVAAFDSIFIYVYTSTHCSSVFQCSIICWNKLSPGKKTRITESRRAKKTRYSANKSDKAVDIVGDLIVVFAIAT